MYFVRFRAIKPILPTWRLKTKFISLNRKPLMKKHRQVTLSNSGRNFSGKRVLHTKCHSIKQKTPLIGFKRMRDTRFYISNTRFNPKSYRFYNVWQGNFGGVNILPAIQGSTIGIRIKLEKFKILSLSSFISSKNFYLFSWPILLADVPFFYKISNIFFNPQFKPKYTTSGGTLSIKLQAEKKEKLIKVKLVSGAIKFFNRLTYCIIGQNYQTFKHNHFVGKAGNNINMGKNKLVRGVAMNPVDHPNGGRTKSCSPELSPWGWVAKLNK